MAVLAAVVGYALPSVKDEPRRLPSWGYRLLALAGAGLAVASLVVFGPTFEGIAAAVFCLALAVVTAADLEYRLIPNRVVLPASVVVLALMTASDGSPEWALAALAAGGGMFAVALAYPAGMGMGDVKLAAVMGLFLGRLVGPALFMGFAAGALVGIALVAARGPAARKQGVPFAPFLALGGVLALLFGGGLIDWYAEVSGLSG
jgi:leader peptidase (prepilin peptidase)/N-methyltransferase